MGTNKWLRMVVYERVPKKYGTFLTFGLSAIWHGWYAGYYITFASGALIVTAARTVCGLYKCVNKTKQSKTENLLIQPLNEPKHFQRAESG